MATIDYKQKIKDYMNSSEVDTLYKSMLSNLFPELKESEDERIRKALIKGINDISGTSNDISFWGGISTNDAIAWLEKQGEKGTNGNEREIPISKPPLTIKYAKEVMGIKQDDAWSEEDDGFWNLLLAIFTNEHPNGVFTTDNIPVFKGNCVPSNRIIAWLSSLKDRVQPKQEWSEEDESMRTRCIGALMKCYMGELPQTVIDEVEWLKSLRPQNRWKPSDLQIKALEGIRDHVAQTSGYWGQTMAEIIEHLKQL